MKRRFFQIAAIGFLLLCGTTLAVWLRSVRTIDSVYSPKLENWFFRVRSANHR